MKNSPVLIRVLCRLVVSLLLGAAVASAAEPVTIVRVFTGWREAASYKRISEYFDGRENTGGETLLRTHPDQRAGFYFLVRVANPGAPASVTFNLQVISATNAKPVNYAFPAELRNGAAVLDLGLTGADWPDPKANPVAWKIELKNADGSLLATEKSYLWDKPAAN